MFQIIVLRLNDSLDPSEQGDSSDLSPLFKASVSNKLTNTFIPGVGLVISVLNVLVKSTLITNGDGKYISELDVKLLVMSPQVGEILTAKIVLSDKGGILASIGDILPVRIPADKLMKTSLFDEKENLWLWRYENYELFYDSGETIRFRVSNVDLQHQNEPIRVFGSCQQDGLGLVAWWNN